MGDEKTTRRPRWQEAEAEMADILYWATMRQRLQRASEALARERHIFDVLAQARVRQAQPPQHPVSLEAWAMICQRHAAGGTWKEISLELINKFGIARHPRTLRRWVKEARGDK